MRGLRLLGTALVLLAAGTVAARSCGDDGTEPRGATPGTTEDPSPGGATATVRRPRAASRPRAGDDAAADASAAAATSHDAAQRDAWPERTHLIQGVVQFAGGSPVADALVTLGDLDDSDTATRSAADGTFGIDEMPSYSSVQAAVLRDGSVWRGHVDADGAPLDLVVTLSPPPEPDRDPMRLVRVVGWDGGRVESAHATIVRRGLAEIGRWSPRIGVGGGWFAVRPEPSEDGAAPAFVVTSPFDAEGRTLPYGPALVDAARLRDPVTEVRLPPGVSFSGRVVGPDGAAVPGTKVILTPPPPDGFDAASMTPWTETTRSADDGRFAFGGLRRGPGRLSVLATGVLARVTDREVLCGGDDVVVQLGVVVGATITVTDDAGKPVEGARVWCLDAAEWTAANTGADGRARLSGLRPGVATTLGVDGAGHVTTTVVGWIAADTQVTLPVDHPIRGVVADAAGHPLHGALLVVDRKRPESPDGPQLAPFDDGSFVVPDMARGDEAELRLVEGSRTVTRVVVAAGTQGVRLVWDDAGRFGVAFEREEDDVWTRGPLVTLRAEGRDIAFVAADARTVNVPVITFDAAPLPDRVDVQVGPLANGRWALLRDVAPRGVLHVPDDAWRSGRAMYGSVTTADGKAPAIGVTVFVSDGDGFAVRTRANRNGGYRVPGAPSSRLTLRAEGDDGAASAACSVDAGTDSVVTNLRLRD